MSTVTPALELPIQSAQLLARHDACLAHSGWPTVDVPANVPADGPAQASALWQWVQQNHRNNSLLWAEEDLARRTTVAAADIAANKRAIDGFNQARNDATERLDEILLVALGLVDAASARTDAPISRVAEGARLNSETAGSMVDRLSILALKINAMRWQTLRQDVPALHRSTSQAKLARLQEQRFDLAGCLDNLLADAQAGRAYFKVYRQFKMYNDASLNPELVKEQQRAPQAVVVQGVVAP